VTANLLARPFDAEGPNQRWVGDTTELRVSESVFLAATLDLRSRFIVGWALSAVNDRQLVIRALEMALRRRCPESGLIHHSDQCSPYASEDYQNVLGAHGVACSTSRRGNGYDNAVAESWFSTLKSELGVRFESYAETKEQLFDYIDAFHNQQRRYPPSQARHLDRAVSPRAVFAFGVPWDSPGSVARRQPERSPVE
jgi:putative transposase